MDFFNSPAFDEMLLKVTNDNVASFRNNNQWLNYHPKEALIFCNLETTWNVLKTTYNGDFRELVFGDSQTADVIQKTLNLINERLSKIKWTIKVEVKDRKTERNKNNSLQPKASR